VARDARWATPGGLSLERWAVIGHLSPLALSRRGCALGQPRGVTGLTRCGLPLPPDCLAAATHSRWLTDTGSLPTMGQGRVIGHLGSTANARAAPVTPASGACPRAAVQQDPS
jgi:hypothetical protein